MAPNNPEEAGGDAGAPSRGGLSGHRRPASAYASGSSGTPEDLSQSQQRKRRRGVVGLGVSPHSPTPPTGGTRLPAGVPAGGAVEVSEQQSGEDMLEDEPLPPTPTAPIAPSAPLEPEGGGASSAELDGLWADGAAWYVVQDQTIATWKGDVFSLKSRNPASASLWASRESWVRPAYPAGFLEMGASVAVPGDSPFQKSLPSHTARHSEYAGHPAKVTHVERGKATLRVSSTPPAELRFDVRAFPGTLGRRCPRGCALKGQVAAHQCFTCDGCTLALPKSSPLLGCREHDFDLCMFCAGFRVEVAGCRVLRGPTHPKRNQPAPGAGRATPDPSGSGGYLIEWENGTSETCRGPPFQDVIPVYGADVCLMGKMEHLLANCEVYSEEIGIRLLRTSESYDLSEDGKRAACTKETEASLISREVLDTAAPLPVFHVEIGDVTGKVSVGLFLEAAEEHDKHIGQADRSIALTSTGQAATVYNSGTAATPPVPLLKKGDVVSMRIVQGQEQGRGELIFFVNGEPVRGGVFNFRGKFRFGVAMDTAGSSVVIVERPPVTCASFEILSRTLKFEGAFDFMDLEPALVDLSDGRKVATCKPDATSKPTVITSQCLPEAVGSCSLQVEAVAFPMAFGMIGSFPDSLGQDLVLGDTLMEGSFGLQATDSGCVGVRDGERHNLTETPLKVGDVITIGLAPERFVFFIGNNVLFTGNLRGSHRAAVTLSPGAAVRVVETPSELMAKHKLSMMLLASGAGSNEALVEQTLPYEEDAPFQFTDLMPSVAISEDGACATCTSPVKCISLTRQAISGGVSALCNFKVVKKAFPIIVGIAALEPDGMYSFALGGAGTLGFYCSSDGCSVAASGSCDKVSGKVVQEGDDLTVGITTNGSIMLYINGRLIHALMESAKGALRFAASLCVEGGCLRLTPPPQEAQISHSVGNVMLGSKSAAPPNQNSGLPQALKAETREYNAGEGFTFMDILKGVDVHEARVATVKVDGIRTILSREAVEVVPGAVMMGSYTLDVAKLNVVFGMASPTPEGLVGHILGSKKFEGTFGVLCSSTGCYSSVDGTCRQFTDKVVKEGDTVEIGWSKTGHVAFFLNGEVFDVGVKLKGAYRMAVTVTENGTVVSVKKPSAESLAALESYVPDASRRLRDQTSDYDKSVGFRFVDQLRSVNIDGDGLSATAVSVHPCTVLTVQTVNAGTPATCYFKVERLRFPVAFGVTQSYPHASGASMLGQSNFEGTMGLVCMDDGCYLAKAGKVETIPGLRTLRQGDVVGVTLTEDSDVVYDIAGKKIPANVKLTGAFRMAISMKEEGLKVVIVDDDDADDAPTPEMLRWDDLDGIRKLADGPRSATYMARIFGLRDVAVKLFRSQSGPSPTAIQTEVRCLQGAHHPYIVPVFGWVRTPQGGNALVTARYPWNLAQFVTQGGGAGAPGVRVVRQVACGLAFFSRSCVHCALKPSNVFVTEAKDGVMGESGMSVCNTATDTATLMYLAPEVLGGAEFSEAADVYSMGMLLRFVVHGGNNDVETMFDLAGESDAPDTARQAAALPFTAPCPEPLKALIYQCLGSPDARPNVKELATKLADMEATF